MAPLHWHLWTFMLLLALHLQASASAMVTSALTKALAKPKPVVVHLYDPKPADLKEYALVDVSIACRDAGTTGILTMPELVKGFALLLVVTFLELHALATQRSRAKDTQQDRRLSPAFRSSQ